MVKRDREFAIVYVLCLIVAFSNGSPYNSKVCYPPLPPSNGQSESHLGGAFIEFWCNYGYTRLGPAYIVCTTRGWAADPPICISAGCPDLGPVYNGQVRLSYGGGQAELSCHQNHSAQGNLLLVCDGRRWNGTIGRCASDLASAKFLEPTTLLLPDNFKGKISDMDHDDWLKISDYSCVTGGGAVQPPNVSHAVPTVRFAYSDGTPRLYAFYRCRWGFIIQGKLPSLYCHEFKWVGVAPSCVRAVRDKEPDSIRGYLGDERPRTHDQWLRVTTYDCQEVLPPYLAFGKFRERHAVVNGYPRLFLQADCNDGYDLKGDEKYMYCQEKQWNGPRPACIRKYWG